MSALEDAAAQFRTISQDLDDLKKGKREALLASLEEVNSEIAQMSDALGVAHARLAAAARGIDPDSFGTIEHVREKA